MARLIKNIQEFKSYVIKVNGKYQLDYGFSKVLPLNTGKIVSAYVEYVKNYEYYDQFKK